MKFARDLFPEIDAIATRQRATFPEIEDDAFWALYEQCKHFSLLHVPGFYNLYQSLTYLSRNKIVGCAVECGCFLGGAAAFTGLMRKHLDFDLEIWLFDTFEGPPIGSTDTFVGGALIETPALLPNYEKQVKATLKEVVGSTKGYHFVVGLVEDTIPPLDMAPIALLRLDTDFYSSTKVEFENFYPRLVSGGVLIIDDYGTFGGSRRATDEYLAGLARPPLLNRIDLGIWSGLKPEASVDNRDAPTQARRRFFERRRRA